MGSAKRVVAIPGEDAAAEAFAATMSLLEDFSLDLDWSHPPVGAAAIQTHGEAFPPRRGRRSTTLTRRCSARRAARARRRCSTCDGAARRSPTCARRDSPGALRLRSRDPRGSTW